MTAVRGSWSKRFPCGRWSEAARLSRSEKEAVRKQEQTIPYPTCEWGDSSPLFATEQALEENERMDTPLTHTALISPRMGREPSPVLFLTLQAEESSIDLPWEKCEF